MRSLDELRSELNTIDAEILSLLDRRFRITDEVAVVKDEAGAPLTDRKREEELISRLKMQAKHPALKEYIEDIYGKIIELNKKARIFNRVSSVPFSRIGVIGLGFIGGSIIKALKSKKNPPFIGTVKRDSADNRYGSTHGYLDREYDSLEEIARDVELVIIATPIDAAADVAARLAEATLGCTGKKLIVIDTCSIKAELTVQFQALTRDCVEFLPTHPMAGSEKTGFANAQAMVFVQKPWILCPHQANKPETVSRVRELIMALGSPVSEMPGEEHDREVAAISHLVFLISTCLFAYCYEKKRDALAISGSGFASITRLASGSPRMHTEIVARNADNIAVSVMEFINFVKAQGLDRESLMPFFENAKKNRDAFFAERARL
ncbi:MAG: prephenate dehydrogenase/arogenate dehydrogenase family protein [Patescibacteria group bacterium]|nr:prephenate dehydrogenase/arogenate dehydrogenase family protein [Patescibacteria group bacterium]